jgi:non-heme chloroperoxidase
LDLPCPRPDRHGLSADKKGAALVGVGMADYLNELEAFLKTVAPQPALLGHSMGGVLAQQLAAKGLARAIVLVSPAPRAGILPQTDSEKQLRQDLMGLGAFWKTVINPDFDLARVLSLNCIPESEQRTVFDRFGPESGRAFFELFFWMFDQTGATKVDTAAITCPVLCVEGADDKWCRQLRRVRPPTAIPARPSGSFKATATCWCSSRAPRRSRAASLRGSRPRRAGPRSLP